MKRRICMVFCIVGFLLLSEGANQFRYVLRGERPWLFKWVGSKPAPKTRNHTTIYGPTSNFPFRSRIVPIEKPSNGLRIWIASASHADDVRFPVSSIFPNRLNLLLSDPGVEIQVINASKTGHLIEDNVRDLQAHYYSWQPDVVVLYGMSMDLRGLLNENQNESPFSKQGLAQGSTNYGLMAEEFKKVNDFLDYTTVNAVLKEHFTAFLLRAMILPASVRDALLDLYMVRVESFLGSCEQLGALPVLCTFATSYRVSTIHEMSVRHANWIARFTTNISVRGWIETIEQLNSRLRALAEKRSIALVDLAHKIGGRPGYFIDPVHFSEKGHKAVAEELRNQLKNHTAFIELEEKTRLYAERDQG